MFVLVVLVQRPPDGGAPGSVELLLDNVGDEKALTLLQTVLSLERNLKETGGLLCSTHGNLLLSTNLLVTVTRASHRVVRVRVILETEGQTPALILYPRPVVPGLAARLGLALLALSYCLVHPQEGLRHHDLLQPAQSVPSLPVQKDRR